MRVRVRLRVRVRVRVRVSLCASVNVCMIIIPPYRLRHWLASVYLCAGMYACVRVIALARVCVCACVDVSAGACVSYEEHVCVTLAIMGAKVNAKPSPPNHGRSTQLTSSIRPIYVNTIAYLKVKKQSERIIIKFV